MHSTLIDYEGKGYLLVGPSGSGKTTLAEGLAKASKVKILANDWVVVGRKKDELQASDLNLSEELKGHSIVLYGIIFLIQHDGYRRDAFSLTDKSYLRHLSIALDNASNSERLKLLDFWKKNLALVDLLAIVPARDKPVKEVCKTVANLLDRRPSKLSSIGVIGLGTIGSILSYELAKLNAVNKVLLYTKDISAAKGCAEDIEQALAVENTKGSVKACSKPSDIFKNCGSVFITFRDKNSEATNDTEKYIRWQRFKSHVQIIRYYAKIAKKTGFQGNVFVITNPVDMLTYAFYLNSGLRTYQVVGVGLELDFARIKYYMSKLYAQDSLNSLNLYGNHSDRLYLQSNNDQNLVKSVSKRAIGAQPHILTFAPRTIYGPVMAAVKCFKASFYGGIVHAAIIENGTFVGRKVQFRNGLPDTRSESLDFLLKKVETRNYRLTKKYNDLIS